MTCRLSRNYTWGLLLALLMAPVLMGEPPAGVASWDDLLKDPPAGLVQGRWQGLVNALKANGFSLEAANACLEPVRDAARQGLPPEAVAARLEEGAAKHVEAALLVQAGRTRLTALRTAAEALKESGYGTRIADTDKLMKTVAIALESGLEARTVKAVLAHGNGDQPDRMQSVIEAGESMRLNTMDDATVAQMMADFIDRNLRRSEVVRASRYAVQQHKAHVDGVQIRQRLWDKEGAGGSTGGGDGKRQGGSLMIKADSPAGPGPVHVNPEGTGRAGPDGNAGPNGNAGPDFNAGPNGNRGPNHTPVTPGPSTLDTDQPGRQQNGRQ
jgi:hypothetical protein